MTVRLKENFGTPPPSEGGGVSASHCGTVLLLPPIYTTNTIHPNIRLSMDYGNSVNFLDLTVFLSDNLLHYKVYFKPTDTHLLLPPSSHHPSHVFRGVLYGQILRLASRCSRRQDFLSALSIKSKVWRPQGYSYTLIRQTKFKVLSLTQQRVDWRTGTFCCDQPCFACPFLLRRDSIQDSASHNAYPIFSRITCSTTHLIYLATCSKGHLYVGQTEKPFRDRIQQHLRAIANDPAASKFHQHFNDCDLPANIHFCGIERVLDREKRLTREQLWIQRLHATLNTQTTRINTRINLSLPFSLCSRNLGDVVRRKCRSLNEPARIAYQRSRSLREVFCTSLPSNTSEQTAN